MAKLLKLRRGTTSQHGSFTGAEGEVTVDTDKETLVVHDGSTAGGHPVAAEDMANVSGANIKGRLGTTLTNAEINASAAIAGSKLANPISLADDHKISFGTGSANNLEIFHESSSNTNEIIAVDGDIHIQADNFMLISDDTAGRAIYLDNGNSRLELGFDGNDDAFFTGSGVTFSTNVDANAGLDVTGNITVTGTVDGADVASMNSKLSGIESGATADQSASEILTAIKTVDGAGSGLDADLLDGVSSASFVRSDVDDVITSQIGFEDNGAYPIVIGATSGSSDAKILLRGSTNPYIQFQEGTTSKCYIQWSGAGYLQLVNEETGEALRIANGSSGLVFVEGGNARTVWHSGNDGTGSTLDADLLDGQHGSYYLDYTNFANKPTIPTNNNQLTNGAGYITSANDTTKMPLAGGEFTGDVICHQLRPDGNNSRSLGTSSYRWSNVFTNDLHLSNEGGANDIDGSWGNWTIQEGESDLFLKNNRSGKKYKFNLTEVS